MRITKRIVDELAEARLELEAAKDQVKHLQTKFDRLSKPIEEEVDKKAGIDDKVSLSGAKYEVVYTAHRKTRLLKDPVVALRRLEDVQTGLGYKSISIPISVLDKNLRAPELADLFDERVDRRNIKVEKLS